MLPNDPVRGSEALTILNRALGASQQDSTASLAASQQDQWYTAELGKAIHLNLIDANDSRNFGNAATRAEAFVYIARAFVYDRAESGADELSIFTDTGSMTDDQRQAAAALVASGIIKGDTATTLAPNKKADPCGICHHDHPYRRQYLLGVHRRGWRQRRLGRYRPFGLNLTGDVIFSRSGT